jgi:predicted TIM-barrel fold metal-dependent hydrolase
MTTVVDNAAQSADAWTLKRVLENGRATTVTFIDEPEPEPLFCPIISVDDHALEPPTLFEGRLPARLQDRAPYFETGDDHLPAWVIGDVRIPQTMNNAAAGRIMSEWALQAVAFDEMRSGVWNPTARLLDMDLAGVWASLCFGSITWGFAGSRFSKMPDPAVGLHCLRAYNDWMIEEWCAAAPDRYIPCQLPWFRDPHEAAKQIYRNAERGFTSVSFSENPEGQGFPNVYDTYWDPFFRACEETETVVNLHVGSSGNVRQPSSSSREAAVVALFPVSGLEAFVDWTFALIPLRFPKLTVALSEAGVSWVPMALERLRRAERQNEGLGKGWPPTAPPMEQAVRNTFVYTSIEDPSAFRMLDIIGEDQIMVETDYPHYDSTWPGCQAAVRQQLQNLSPEQIRKVCFENAARIYRHPAPPQSMIDRSEVAAMGRSAMDGS